MTHYTRWRTHGDPLVGAISAPKDECSIDGCARRGPIKRDLCPFHYRRWRSNGDPLVIKKGQRGTPLERFWRLIIKDGPIPELRPDLGPCWQWLGFHDKDGYGRLHYKGIFTGAHRVAYEEVFGQIPTGMEPDHLCRNRGCPNPNHLEPVTTRVNIMRGQGHAPRNAAKTHCTPGGHPFSGDNLYVQPDGKRVCRQCKRDRKHAAKKRAAGVVASAS